MRLALLALWPLFLLSPAFADSAAEPASHDAIAAQIRTIVDATTLDLADGSRLRLVNIAVPTESPYADDAKAAVAAWLAAGPVTLRPAAMPRDRQGRLLAEAYVGSLWIEGDLVRRGLARVQSTADNRADVPALLALEREARRYHRGLWRDRAYAIVKADDAARFAGTYQIVSGTVATIRASAAETVLAFGTDRDSFAVMIAPAALALCRAAGLEPTKLQGKTLVVRGFIDGRLHPIIAITHPEQIEMLRRKKAAPKQGSEPRQKRTSVEDQG